MIFLYFALILMLLTIAWGAWTFAPWVPMHARDIPRVLNLAGDLRGKSFVELGSGDGRVTLAAAETGAKATAYEIAIPLFAIGYLRGKWRNSSARFVFGDFYSKDLSYADVIFLFGVPKTNAEAVRIKLERELKPGTTIISYAFEIEGWKPEEKSKPSPDDLPIYKYLWKR